MTSAGRDGRTVFLSAGESSGDLHAARLARELLRRDQDLRLVGLGGSRMRDAGVELLADLDTLAVMGFTEVVRSLPKLLLLRWRVRRWMAREEVDLLIPVDYPGFNLSLACHANDRNIPVLYYIAPQVWAWRASRARKLADCTDRVCVVLPFEEEFLSGYGAEARFVGHPLLDEERTARADGPAADSDRGWEAGGGDGEAAEGRSPVLGLFPGSRAQEVERILPPFRDAARRLASRQPGLEVWVARAPDLSSDLFAGGDERLAPPGEVLQRSRAALTKSGTVTLQLALAGVPMVVGYRVNPVTYLLARQLVDVEHVALVNLVAGRRLVPELIQHELAPERIVEEAAPLLDPDAPERQRMLEGLEEVSERLGESGCTDRVADEAFGLLRRDG